MFTSFWNAYRKHANGTPTSVCFVNKGEQIRHSGEAGIYIFVAARYRFVMPYTSMTVSYKSHQLCSSWAFRSHEKDCKSWIKGWNAWIFVHLSSSKQVTTNEWSKGSSAHYILKEEYKLYLVNWNCKCNVIFCKKESYMTNSSNFPSQTKWLVYFLSPQYSCSLALTLCLLSFSMRMIMFNK